MLPAFAQHQSIKDCVAALPRPRSGPPRSRQRMEVRLFWERLEDRLSPVAVSWTGNAGDNNWGTRGNWSNNAVPTSAYDVTINKSGVGATTTGASSYAVQSLNDTSANLSIFPDGTLSLAAGAPTSTFGQNVTVQSGETLHVGSATSARIGTRSSGAGLTQTDDGTLTFASGDTVSLDATGYAGTEQIVIGDSFAELFLRVAGCHPIAKRSIHQVITCVWAQGASQPDGTTHRWGSHA